MASDLWIAASMRQSDAEIETIAARLYEGRPLVKPGVRSLTPQPDKSPGERCRVKRLSKVSLEVNS
jgi:hypothetical protein